MRTMTEPWTRDSLAENVHTGFSLVAGDGSHVDLELSRVSGLHETGLQRNFSVVFLGPKDRPVGQGTYRMEHEKLGSADIFIVPVALTEKGFEYEAVFNLLK